MFIIIFIFIFICIFISIFIHNHVVSTRCMYLFVCYIDGLSFVSLFIAQFIHVVFNGSTSSYNHTFIVAFISQSIYLHTCAVFLIPGPLKS